MNLKIGNKIVFVRIYCTFLLFFLVVTTSHTQRQSQIAANSSPMIHNHFKLCLSSGTYLHQTLMIR